MIENNNYIDELELLIKEAAENFRMIPERKLWQSIYNNSHPARKWPSVKTILLLFFSYLFLGKSNSILVSNTIKPLNSRENTSYNYKKRNNYTNDNSSKKSSIVNQEIKRIKANNPIQLFGNKENSTSIIKNLFAESTDKEIINLETLDVNRNNIRINFNEEKNKVVKINKADLVSENKNYKATSNSNNLLSYQLYATSSFGFRNVSKSDYDLQNQNNFDLSGNSSPVNFQFQQFPGINIEAGGAFLIDISRLIKLKAGMQFNYSNNKIKTVRNSYAIEESMQSVMLNSDIPDANNDVMISNGFTIPSKYFLNNNSYQISMPLGTEFELAGNNLLQWYAGATIQPSYLLSGGSPLLPTNRIKDNVFEESYLRKWNINTSIETFLSYKLKNGATINAGPQVRYQLLPTYNSRYNFNEKLYNVGLKLGISRNL